MVAKSTGKEYEELVQHVMEGLIKINGDGLSNVEVRRNVILDGMTALPNGHRSQHQIDIFWEFDIGPTSYRTVIQAKDWKRKVSLPELHTFLSVLADLPGNPKGLMVTTKGYQRGVEQLAQARGVELCLLKPATQEDFGGAIPSIAIAIDPYFTRVQNAASHFEEPLADRPTLNAYMAQNAHDIPLFDADGNQVGVFSGLYAAATQQLMSEMMIVNVESIQRAFTQVVDRPTYVRSSPEAKLEKITQVQFTLTLYRVSPKVTITNSITHIFRSATGDRTYTVDQNFRVIKPGDELTIEHMLDLRPFPNQ